jgi:4-amino-4-deoxy-L-arabinose transferase-like glycosyltransferase
MKAPQDERELPSGPSVTNKETAFLPLWPLLIAAALLLIFWSFLIPIFESPDEPAHWDYARYLHDHWRLPPYNSAYVEGNQPPLYYLLIASFSAESPAPASMAHMEDGKAISSCPPRFYENCFSDFSRYWPIRIARLMTVLISLGTVLFTVLAGRDATGNKAVGLLAGAMVAFLPQFTFRGSNISNDAMVASGGAAATWLLVRFARTSDWRAGLWCAVTTAIAFLSKINAIVLSAAFAVGIASLRLSVRERLQRVVLLLITGVIVLPWLLQNQLLYGDPLAMRAMPLAVPWLVEHHTLTEPYFQTQFPAMVWRSFLGVFGWMNVPLPEGMYRVYRDLSLVALIGLMIGFVQRKLDRRVLGLLVLIVFLSVASLIQLNLTFTQPQGRYLFPALSATMVLLAMGFSSFPKWNVNITYGLVILLAALNLYVAVKVVYRAYWKPLRPWQTMALDTGIPDPVSWKSQPSVLQTGHSYVQSFVAKHDNLNAVEVELAKYGRKLKSGELKLHLRSELSGSGDIAAVTLPGSKIQSCCAYMLLPFDPIPDSKGKTYYVSIETSQLPLDRTVAVFLSPNDDYSEGEFFVDNIPQKRDAVFRTYYTAISQSCPQCLLRAGTH